VQQIKEEIKISILQLTQKGLDVASK